MLLYIYRHVCALFIISKHSKNDLKCLFALFFQFLLPFPPSIYCYFISAVWRKAQHLPRITALTGTWLAFFLTMAAGAVPVVIRWRCEGGEFGKNCGKTRGYTFDWGFCVGHDFVGKKLLYM